MKALQEEKRYTYSDYLAWDDDVRYELIDGIPYMLASPSVEHQRVLRGLFGQLYVFLEGKPCEVFSAPFDVRLNADGKDDDVVQPDLLVVCDKTKLDKTCNGAPDMIIEILSPSSVQRDSFIKLMKYQKYGVREYWIVDPESQAVNVFLLENGKYTVTTYTKNDHIPVHVLSGCTINLSDVFAD